MSVPGNLYTPTIRKTRGGLVEVTNSALFDSGSSQYLSLNPGQNADSGTTFTLSAWVYRAGNGVHAAIFEGNNAAVSEQFLLGFDTSDKLRFFQGNGNAADLNLTSSAVYRDIGWYHVFAVFDSTESTDTNRGKVWINGDQITSWSSSTWPSLNEDELGWTKPTASSPMKIGIRESGGSNYSNMYLAEACYFDGTVYAPTDVGEFSTDGNYWTPKSSDDIKALTFGTNGFYLDNATNAETDASGNGNSFTNNGSVTTSNHTPTNIYATLNSVDGPVSKISTLSNGNLTFTDSTSDWQSMRATLPMTTGKWYWECVATTSGNPGDPNIGIVHKDVYMSSGWYLDADAYCYSTRYDSIVNNSWTGTPRGTYTAGDTLQIAFDADDGKLWFGINGTWINGGDPAAGTSADFTGITAGTYFPYVGIGYSRTGTLEFGQNGFSETAPTGFSALNTTNIAAATTRTVSDVYEHWANGLRTGTAADATITVSDETPNGSSFDPDFIWLKSRSNSGYSHRIVDIVRGATKELRTNSTNAEATDADGVTAFGSGTVSIGADAAAAGYNVSGHTYVDWMAKLGGTAVSNTDGSITSSVSVNTTLGMSVGTYTGTGSNATIGHGLGVAPKMVIVKQTNAANGWRVYHDGIANTEVLNLGSTAAKATEDGWNSTSPTSSVISLGTSSNVNTSSATYMFIAFAESPFISIGSYNGNANADGVMIPTINSDGIPLQPIWSLVKDTANNFDWMLHDNARDSNLLDLKLNPNNSNAESTDTGNAVDYVTGGIKARGASAATNGTALHIHLTIGIPMLDVDGRILTAR